MLKCDLTFPGGTEKCTANYCDIISLTHLLFRLLVLSPESLHGIVTPHTILLHVWATKYDVTICFLHNSKTNNISMLSIPHATALQKLSCVWGNIFYCSTWYEDAWPNWSVPQTVGIYGVPTFLDRQNSSTFPTLLQCSSHFSANCYSNYIFFYLFKKPFYLYVFIN